MACNVVAPGLTLTAGAVNNASKEYIEVSLRITRCQGSALLRN
jgi:hypothetical protein